MEGGAETRPHLESLFMRRPSGRIEEAVLPRRAACGPDALTSIATTTYKRSLRPFEETDGGDLP